MWLVMLSYKVKSNAVCLAAYSSLLRGLISRSVRSRTLQVQTYIKHNHSNKKSDFLWVNMFQTQSYPLKTSVCWHRKCFISTLVTYPCVCVLVCVCVGGSLSVQGHHCVLSGDISVRRYMTHSVWRCFPTVPALWQADLLLFDQK